MNNYLLKIEYDGSKFVGWQFQKNGISVQETIEKKLKKINPKFSTTGGTSDARFIKKISPCLEFGLVNKTMHRVDECVSLSDLKKLTKI